MYIGKVTIEDKVAFREFQNVTVGSISKNKNIDLRCRRLYNCVQSHGGATSKQLHASSESVTSRQGPRLTLGSKWVGEPD